MKAPGLAALLLAAAAIAGEPPGAARPSPPLMLDGKPFPQKRVFEPVLRTPRRTLFVSPAGKASGNGSEKRPWNDLKAAMQSLRPGDRLVLLPGDYTGPFGVDETCRDGTADAPIQMLGRDGAVLRASDRSAVLSVTKAHWIFQGIRIVPGRSSQAPGFSTVGLNAHDVVFDRGDVSEGRGPGILIGSGSQRITISNSRIHHFRGGGPKWSHGIFVYSQTGDLRVLGNIVHDNEGSGLFVEGARGRGKGMRSYIEGLSIVGNTFRNDGMHGVKVRGAARRVQVTHNEFRGYRPARNSRGSAILMYPTTRDSIVEDNAILDSTVGIHLGASDFEGTGKGIGPLNIGIQRNYISCAPIAESAGLRVDMGRRVRINNNVIRGCEEALHVDAMPPEGEGFSVANNLVMDPTRLAFSFSSPAAAEFFGNNVFSVRSGRVSGRLAGQTRDLRKSWKEFAMPGTAVTSGVTLAGDDLARITGVRVVDAGMKLEGISYKGVAPDIGIAEK